MATVLFSVAPGLSGAIAVWVDGRLVEVAEIPTLSRPKAAARRGDGTVRHGVVSEVNVPALSAIFRKHAPEDRAACATVIERVGAMPKNGAVAMFAFGKAAMAPEAVSLAYGIPVEFLRPQEWKKALGLGQDKEESRMLAQRLYPNLDFSKKSSHNMAEAVLIGRVYLSRRSAAAATKEDDR